MTLFKRCCTIGYRVILFAIALLIWYGWVHSVQYATGLSIQYGLGNYYLALGHMAGLCFLLVVLAPYHRWVAPLGIGRVMHRSSVWPTVAVILVYLAGFIYSKLLSEPPEQWVLDLLNKPAKELSAVFITIFLLAPVGEEILFRGVMLNAFKTSHSWTIWVGACLVAVLFSLIHKQYNNISTFVEFVALSGIYTWARVRSGGLLLPILLHSLSALTAVILIHFY